MTHATIALLLGHLIAGSLLGIALWVKETSRIWWLIASLAVLLPTNIILWDKTAEPLWMGLLPLMGPVGLSFIALLLWTHAD